MISAPATSTPGTVRDVVDPVAAIYERHLRDTRAITPHLSRLRGYANRVDVAVEFGVKHGASSSALLLGAREVYSYDILETPEARELERVAGERWHYHIADSRKVTIPCCGLLFIDSQHDYRQCKAELERHADKVSRFLIFHDTLTFGSVGARGESGEQLWTYELGVSVPPRALGIRPAIDELMARDPSWSVYHHYTDSHGLLVLERVS